MHAAANHAGTVNMSSKGSQSGQYVMPVESAKHSHTLMAFPSIESAADEDHLAKMQSEIIDIANTIAKFEPIHLYTRKELTGQVRSMVQPNVDVKEAIVNELWIRDSGPVFVKNRTDGQLTAVKFNFNYWGNKLPLKGDEKLAQQIAASEAVPLAESLVTIEGGAIEHDGAGTFLGAASCVLNENRNPSLTKDQVEAELKAKLGVTHFIWVPGLRGHDITDYHIDALARFIEPGVILLSKPGLNAASLHQEAYKEARNAILDSQDAQGRTPVIHECEEPDVSQLGVPGDEFNAVEASYVNYLHVNGAVIMPKFGQEKPDAAAFELFKKLFPSKEVIQVLINMLPRTGGGIHCATQQVPA